ncbi:CAP domain-containing protein [Geopyxis carbonaria]|nr:CAP domain-containing protein [Geopyxis carbonaria]
MLNLSNSLTLVLMLASSLAVQAAPSPGYGYGDNAPANNVVYYTKTITQSSYQTPAPQKNNGGWSWKKTWRHKHAYHGYQKPKTQPAPAPKKQTPAPKKYVAPAPKYQAPAYTPKAPAATQPKPTPKPVTPKPAPVTPKPAPATGGSELERGMLQGHNTLRAQYGAAPLRWSASLAAAAQAHASKCVFEHSGDPAGENIAGGSDIPGVCKMWGADEASTFGGHFTQMVWKATKEVGCARVQCGSNVIGGDFTVCQYLPAGNMGGAYAQNVQGYQ